MFRSLLNVLGFGANRRFADWPEARDFAPILNIAERKISGLRFGSSIEEARVLSRPDGGKQTRPDTNELLYARLALLLEFGDTEGLEYAAFFVAPDRHDPRHSNLRHQPVTLSTGEVLSAQTSEPELVRIFGAPREIDRDDDETVIFHRVHGMEVECELTTAGTLKRLNIFPAQD
jgi:hypothetical protein